MEKEKLKALFARYLNNELTPEEARALFRQLETEQDLSEIRQVARNKIAELKEMDFDNDPRMQPVYDRVYQKILAQTEDKIVALPVKRKYWPRVAASAAILALISIGCYFLFFNINYLEPPLSQTLQPANDIAPGGNKATLTLTDGSRIVLDEAGIGELAQQGGIQISKTKDGQIVYDASSLAEEDVSAVSYNKVSTPKGGQYQVILPDGTKVWLNAASSLRYPTAFTGNERKVELRGEGYFEVAHDEIKPFFVKSGNQEIKVLGTHFNVMAYEDEREIRTTLLEGRVMVSVDDNRKQPTKNKKLLLPGHQARVIPGRDKIMIIPDINTVAVLAWKNDRFIFEGEKLESIMRKISRWYNVEIVYRGEVTDNDFIGTVSRFENVSEVLNLLQLTGTVHFKIESQASKPAERRIIVMP